MRILYSMCIGWCLILFNASFCLIAHAEKIVISGETASNGIYDPSIEYTEDGSIGYMIYTACDNWPLYIHTHLAKTTDHGRTWTFVQRINESTPAIVDVYGTTHTGMWHHETATLIHDPDDPGKEWKLYWGHHFFKAPYHPSNDKVWSHGWIGYKYATDPEGAWSAETRMFGAGSFPPLPYTVQIDLNALDPRLSGYITHIEPGGIYWNNTLYLAFQANTAQRADQIIHLIKSVDHGVSWSFVDVLGDSTTASALGYEFLSAPSLVQEENELFLFYCGGHSGTGATTHDGTLISKITDIDNALLEKNSDSEKPEIYKHLYPTYSTHNSGESDYDAFNTSGGIVFPQLQLTPSIEFQIWNTNEPLFYTPVPTLPVTQTPTEQSGDADTISVYPVPADHEIRFLIPVQKSSEVSVQLYNMNGEPIAKISTMMTAGARSPLIWNCKDVAAGIYIAVLSVEGVINKRVKVVVL